jgi:hypothetical protein
VTFSILVFSSKAIDYKRKWNNGAYQCPFPYRISLCNSYVPILSAPKHSSLLGRNGFDLKVYIDDTHNETLEILCEVIQYSQPTRIG